MPEPQNLEHSSIPLKHASVLRGPFSIAFDITSRCNFRCLHCYNRSGENPFTKDELSDSEVNKFIEDAASFHLHNFCFCGGEPMLRENLLFESTKILSSHGVLVSMVSNGSLITKEKAEKLISNGIQSAQISLDGARPETHERLRPYKNAFQLAVNAIKYLKEAGCRLIMVSFVPTSFNWNEVEETCHLVTELGASTFRIQPLMILGRAQQQSLDLIPSPLQYRSIVRTIYKLKKENKIEIEWGDPIDHLIRFRLTDLQHCITSLCIRATGDIEVSKYLPLTVGNVRRHSIKEYWDAGLARSWEIPKVKEIASKILTVEDFGSKEEGVPTVFYEEDIKLDLIDDMLIKI